MRRFIILLALVMLATPSWALSDPSKSLLDQLRAKYRGAPVAAPDTTPAPTADVAPTPDCTAAAPATCCGKCDKKADPKCADKCKKACDKKCADKCPKDCCKKADKACKAKCDKACKSKCPKDKKPCCPACKPGTPCDKCRAACAAKAECKAKCPKAKADCKGKCPKAKPECKDKCDNVKKDKIRCWQYRPCDKCLEAMAKCPKCDNAKHNMCQECRKIARSMGHCKREKPWGHHHHRRFHKPRKVADKTVDQAKPQAK